MIEREGGTSDIFLSFICLAEFFHTAGAVPAPSRCRSLRLTRGLRLTSPASWASLHSPGVHSKMLCTQVWKTWSKTKAITLDSSKMDKYCSKALMSTWEKHHIGSQKTDDTLWYIIIIILRTFHKINYMSHYLLNARESWTHVLFCLYSPPMSSTPLTATHRLQQAALRAASRPLWKKGWASASPHRRTWSCLCRPPLYHLCALSSCLKTAHSFHHQSRP